jgi:retron-type reverse transcriptase
LSETKFRTHAEPGKNPKAKLVGLIERHGKVRICKQFSEKFPIQNGIKQGDALSPLLFNFISEFGIRKVQGNQVGLKWNGTHQLMAYADDVNILGDNLDTTRIKKNTNFN